jgi:hypothetical protein
MERYARRPDESEISYHKRLVYGKLVDKTLADVDYSELAPYVYGQAYSSDVARRMMYGSKRTLDLIEKCAEQNINSGDILETIQTERLELQKERQRFYDQRREYNKLVSVDARRENLESCLIDAAENLNESIGALYGGSYCVNTDPTTEAVLVFCDWHYGLTTNNIWNNYNTAICKTRVQSVVQNAIQKITLHGCSKLHIIVLGDLIHGAIHTSARVASEELVCEQIMNVSELLAQSINELSRYVDETIVYITYGNHARTVQRKEDSIHRDNMERLISWWLKERLKNNDGVQIAPESADEFIFVDTCGHGICASHGDLDSVKSSTRLLPTLFQKKYGRDIECVLLADKHHRENFEELGVNAMICGALCGSDDYANGKRLYSTPEQTLLIVTKDLGIDAEYRIKCM